LDVVMRRGFVLYLIAMYMALSVCSARASAAEPIRSFGTGQWRSIMLEAAQRFAIPVAWIDAIIQTESAGCPFLNGQQTTSPAGAMGLMQIMPQTWSRLARELGLGPDPYDPHDNIMAGAAYVRELYDRFGVDGFLAAYYSGPERYESFLRDGRVLPEKTLDYIVRVREAVIRACHASISQDTAVRPAESPLFVTLDARPLTIDRLSIRPDVRRLFVARASETRIADGNTRVPPSSEFHECRMEVRDGKPAPNLKR
jgi:hypothetical protein